MDKKIIEGIQTIITDLSAQADGHVIQSRIFASAGFSKLADKYAGHASEERGFVTQFVDRLLDLGIEVKLGATKPATFLQDPVEWIKYDLQVSIDGLDWLKELTKAAGQDSDYITFDILKAYYEDEEEDLYWDQAQLELIEKIGVQNWLFKQL